MLLDLIRHGTTGRAGFMDGRTDHPLTTDGWAQIAAATEGRRWSRIVSSPLRRAREPAEQLAKQRYVDHEITPDWSELDFGDWDGRTRTSIEAADGARLAAFFSDPVAHPPPRGETAEAFDTRILRALERLLSNGVGDEDIILVIAHAGSIRGTIALACGLPRETMWAFRIDHGTRVRLRLGTADGNLWGEIIEIAQP